MDRSIGYRSSFGSSGFPRFMFVFGLLLFAASSCAFASQPCEPLPEASGTISGCDHGGKRNIMGTYEYGYVAAPNLDCNRIGIRHGLLSESLSPGFFTLIGKCFG